MLNWLIRWWINIISTYIACWRCWVSMAYGFCISYIMGTWPVPLLICSDVVVFTGWFAWLTPGTWIYHAWSEGCHKWFLSLFMYLKMLFYSTNWCHLQWSSREPSSGILRESSIVHCHPWSPTWEPTNVFCSILLWPMDPGTCWPSVYHYESRVGGASKNKINKYMIF